MRGRVSLYMQAVRESLTAEGESPPDAAGGPRSGPILTPLRTEAKIRTVIADDQLIARRVLSHLVQQEPDLEIVAMAASGAEAIDTLNQLQPDLVLLDVQMPEADGFSVLSQIRTTHRPVVIFVTASADAALKAFEVEALDYLLKPCTRERFHAAVQRARKKIHRDKSLEVEPKALLEDTRTRARPAERLAVKSSGRIIFLRVADIDCIEAADNYVELHVGPQTHLLRETMAELETKLPSDRFLRISRSAIVNLDRIKELAPLFHGEYAVVLRDGKRLTLTRGYRQKLESLTWL